MVWGPAATGAAQPQRWRRLAGSVERGLQLAVGLIVVVTTAAFGLFYASWSSYDAEEVLLAAAIVLGVGLVGIRCLQGRPGGVDLVMAEVAMVAGILLRGDATPEPGTLESPVSHLLPPLLLIIVNPRRRPAQAMIATTLLFIGTRWAVGGTDSLLAALEETPAVLGAGLAVLFVASRIRLAARDAERTLQHRRDADVARLTAAEVDAVAFLHDDLIPTLLAVAGIPEDPVTLAAVDQALERIEEHPPTAAPNDLAAALRGVTTREGLQAVFDASGVRWRLPEQVTEALLGAASEALRNVARHSGQNRVEVTVRRRPGSVMVRIQDPGIGFEAKAGVGLRVAVRERIAAIGGVARVHSVPGSGTTVDLVWHSRWLARLLGVTEDRDELIRAAIGEPGQVAARAGALVGVGYGLLAAQVALDVGPQPWSWAGAVAVVVLAGAVVSTMGRRPVPLPAQFVVALLVAGVLAVALPTVSDEGLRGTGAWLVGFATLPLITLAWLAPARMVVLLVAPSTAVTLWVGVQADLGFADTLHLVLTQPLTVGFVSVLATTCLHTGSELVLSGDDRAPDWSTAVEAQLGAILQPVRETLRRAAAHQITPEDADRATGLARSVRDCLYLPGPEHVDLRSELAALRASGARVEVIFSERPGGSRTLANALAALQGLRLDQVTISGGDQEVRVVAVPGVAGEDATRLRHAVSISWQAMLDPEASVLTGPPDLARVIRRGGRPHAPG